MKGRFTTADIVAVVSEIREKCLSLRVSNVYDIDNKTYLIKMSKPDLKITLLFESGIRMHLTEFDWPKNINPSGFSMKLRKHIKNKRLENISLVGVDRIVDLQFGTGDYSFHLLVELYDRGNALLTDKDYTIVHLLRPRTDKTDQTKIITTEKYPLDKARTKTEWDLSYFEAFKTELSADPKSNMRRIMSQNFLYGDALLNHCMLQANVNAKSLDSATPQVLLDIFLMADDIIKSLDKGDIIKPCITVKPAEKSLLAVKSEVEEQDVYSELDFLEFHPMEYSQISSSQKIHFPSYNKAVDEFFLKMKNQKVDQKVIQMEKAAMKKLDNIKLDHEKRLNELLEVQVTDRKKGEMIEMNLELVEKALLVINSALANQLDWDDIDTLVKDAQNKGDPVATRIKTLKLDKNMFTLILKNPFEEDDQEFDIDIDLGSSAYNNAKRYFDMKKQSAAKEEKTRKASTKAYKAADIKTQIMLKEVHKVTAINKLRKPFWFEKFYWFISSENYLVIGGRDQTQNELIVKRYMTTGDLYVHADLHGASSIVIKNPSGEPVPPKTLNETGFMAVIYSNAWGAKVLTNAWWVYHHQVSKSAPTGEYLTAGSFMIRGKKNFLPPVQLVYGFGILFKVDEESVGVHAGERAVGVYGDQAESVIEEVEDEEVQIDEGGDDDAVAVEEEEEPDLAIRYQYKSDGKFEVKTEPVVSTQVSVTSTTNSNRNRVDSVASLSSAASDISKRKMSAKERRLAKAGKDLTSQTSQVSNVSNDDVKEEQEVQLERDSVSTCSTEDGQNQPQKSTSSTNKLQPQVPLTRGQKSKAKKMNKKYKEQDEEDRELAMQLLCSAGKAKPAPQPKNKKGQKVPHQQVASAQQPKPKPVKDVNVKPKDADAVADEDGDDIEEKDLSGDLALLNSLTGIPLADDILHYAIPVCAPYQTLANYKYKVKMTPGTGKKGKAVKTVLNMFTNDKTCLPKEKDLLKAIRDTELCTNIPGKVKISIPGGVKKK